MMPPPSCLAVVPARPLRRLPSRPRTPSSRTRRAPRGCGRRSRRRRSILSLRRPGSNSLSCTTPCLTAGLARAWRDCERLVEVVGDRLLAVDVLAGRDRLGRADRRAAASSPRRRRPCRRVGRAPRRGRWSSARCRDCCASACELVRVAADQDRVGHDPVAVRQRDAALLADRQDRADQMLVDAHAPGDAVHDDAKIAGGHAVLLLLFLAAANASRRNK